MNDAMISPPHKLTLQERQQLLVEWNATAADFPACCVHQLFEQQVAETPNVIALIDGEQALTYQALNRRANQLAHRLRMLGIQPDELVGICIERSLNLFVGLLGIFKAGGAYVPLDASYPTERIAYMLQDSAVRVLLTTKAMVQQLALPAAATADCQVICLDENEITTVQATLDNPISPVQPHNLAYCIYTSGSTGNPKGALMEHRSLINMIWWHKQTRPPVLGVKTLQFCAVSFDFSFHEIFATLCLGGVLILVAEETRRNAFALAEFIHDQAIEKLFLPVTALVQLAEAVQDGPQPNALREVITTGEILQITPAIANLFRHTGAMLHNHYGATEFQDATTLTLQGDPANWPTLVPVGWPLHNVQVYILDEQGELVAVGEEGEFCIGGVGVARGYLNRPDLNQQKFVPNPFAPGLLYKTGDLARHRPDGSIEHLGRMDQQVKIRGFRVELGEIEATLRKHPAVRECAVVTREDAAGNKQLVGYLVPADKNDPAGQLEHELWRYLQVHLPEYMVPTRFLQIETMPLTPSGKLDRRALPAPDLFAILPRQPYAPPHTPTERTIADIWSVVLGIEQIGIHDNFFALGGDSILSIQVLVKAKQAGLNLSLQQLFQQQTIEALAGQVSPVQEDLPPTVAFGLLSATDRQRLPDDVEDAYPLAALQAGMLFHSELTPESAVYHDIFSYQLQAPFVVALFRQAVQALIKTHEILRTSFALTDFTEPLQLVQRSITVPIDVVDLRELSTAAQIIALDHWFAAEKQRPFVWQSAPLLRLQVHRLTDERFNLILSFHHAILDGWSVATLLTELLQYYFVYLNHGVVNPPALAVSYRDFIALERRTLADDGCRHYWQTALNDATVSRLPRWLQTNRTNSTADVGQFSVSFGTELSARLQQLAQQAGVPIKNVLLAAHLNVLRVLSNQTDIVTGLVSNGRLEVADGERSLGNFLNTVPFRLSLKGGSWLELVQQVFEQERQLLPFRRYPLAAIQQLLGGSALFETAFNFVNFHVYDRLAAIPGLTLLEEQFFEQTNFTFGANFSLDARSNQISLDLAYDTSAFCTEQMAAIGGYYEKTLSAMSNQPKACYSTYSLLHAAEQDQLLVKWNDTAINYPTDKCIHHLFEQQVERTPDAIAVVLEDQQLTYCQLNARANQLAHHLQQLGVGAETLVGVCLERSLELLVSFWAILKAGGVYLPLDPRYPADRLAFMLEDATTTLVVSKTQHRPLFAENLALLDLDVAATAVNAQPVTNPVTNTTGESLAYIIYTSGSTGQPKGVLLEHGGLCNLAMAQIEQFAVRAESRFLQVVSPNFDVSVGEFVTCLCAGATLVLAPPHLLLSREQLTQLINNQSITHIEIPPVLLATLNPAELPTVQSVITGGETFPTDLTRRWSQQRFINAYGPTETTISATLLNCTAYPLTTQSPPIGKPLANKQIYLLDADLQPVPVGVPGELYIGGVGVARGYLNRPELTAERFIVNPFAAGRLYRTGDLACWLPDGVIKFLGRIDFQVKIRGFRIELGEIESALLAQAGVRTAVVLVREDAGDKRLVAYFVGEADPARLRQALAQRLPEYMVPGAFVRLDALPQTPNGKLDRKALPAPDYAAVQSAFVAPRTVIESKVAAIWQEVLGITQVGVYDNFFALGGHSLLATQVIARLRNQFGLDISLKSLFEASQLGEFATAISRAGDSGATAIQPVARDQLLPLSLLQAETWRLSQSPTSGSAHLYNAVGLFRLTGRLAVHALQQSFQALIARHEILRTGYQQTTDGLWQCIALTATVDLPVLDLSDLTSSAQSAEIERRYMIEVTQRLDLTQMLLLRLTLIRLAPEEHILVITTHHIAADNWSLSILMHELGIFYACYGKGESVSLAPLPFQYADYASWQRSFFTPDVLAERQRYWQRCLLKPLLPLQLPTDHPRSPQQQGPYHAQTEAFALSTTLSRQIRQLSQAHQVSVSMLLLAAYATLLYHASGQTDLVIASPTNKRHQSGTELLIGHFAGIALLRLELSASLSFADLLLQTKQAVVDALTYQDITLRQLVEITGSAWLPNRPPQFQATFNFFQQEQAIKAYWPEVTVTSVEMEQGHIVADLTLMLWEESTSTSDYRICGKLKYRQDLFEVATMRRMSKNFQSLLAMFVAEPTRPLAQSKLSAGAQPSSPSHEQHNQDVNYGKPTHVSEHA